MIREVKEGNDEPSEELKNKLKDMNLSLDRPLATATASAAAVKTVLAAFEVRIASEKKKENRIARDKKKERFNKVVAMWSRMKGLGADLRAAGHMVVGALLNLKLKPKETKDKWHILMNIFEIEFDRDNGIDALNEMKQTRLWVAAESGDHEIVKLLASKSFEANLEAADTEGRTALFIAAEKGNLEVRWATVHLRVHATIRMANK